MFQNFSPGRQIHLVNCGRLSGFLAAFGLACSRSQPVQAVPTMHSSKSTLATFLLLALAVLLPAGNSCAATNYQQWLGQYGLPLDSTGLGAHTAAPATDSIPNLIKFSLGLNPWQSGYAGRYRAGITNNAGQNYLALTYASPYPAPNGIAISGEFSSNMATWFDAAGTQIGNLTNSGLQSITIRDAVPVAGAAARFTRLKVTVTAILPTNTMPPQVTGTAAIGQTLTATSGIWNGGSEPPACTYQWTRNGTNISGATNTTYLYGADDVGGIIAVQVKAVNIAGSTTVTAPLASPEPEQVVIFQTGASTDDAASVTNATGDIASTMYWPYSSTSRMSFLRWKSQIPPGATITAAYVKVMANGEAGNASASVNRLQLLDYGNCPVFASTANPFTWPTTTNSVDSTVPGIWTSNQWVASDDIKSLIQEYIDRGDYTYGNYLGLRGSFVSGNWKRAYTWDYGDHSSAPQLEVHYTGGQAMLSLWMADPETRLGQKVYTQIANRHATDTLRVKLDGNVIYAKAAPISTSEEVFTADYRSLLAGSHTLLVEILDGNGSVRGAASRTWTKLHNGIAKVAINEHNAICRDGVPFFPITPWGIGINALPIWAGQINTLCGQSFGLTKNLTSWSSFLQDAETANYPIMGPAMGDFFPGGYSGHLSEVPAGSSNWVYFTSLDMARVTEYINASKDSPALMMYVWQDEPDLGGPSQYIPATEVRRWTDKCHELDTEHLHYLNLVGYPFAGPGPHPTYNNQKAQSYSFLYDDRQTSPMGTNQAFADKTLIADVLAFDYYPYDLATNPSYSDWVGLSDLALALDHLRQWNYNLMPAMTWIETVDVNADTNYPTPAPLPTQLNNLIWLSIIHEVKGIQWFHYDQANAVPTSAENRAVMDTATKWITALTQPILSAPENVTWAVTNQGVSGGRVDTMTRQYDNRLYIFATSITTNGVSTNGMAASSSVRFDLPGLAAGQTIGVLGEGRTVTSSNGYFSDAFSPLAVHIYTYPALTNLPPVADAGADQQVPVATTNSVASVSLNGAGSFDADGTISSYVWKDGATQIAMGATASVNLAAGAHVISLIVTDNGGAKGTNTVTVLMTPPPVANAGPDQQVTDTNNAGSVTIALNGSGSSAAWSTITNYAWSLGGNPLTNGMTAQVTLIAGTNNLTLTVTDNYGATGSDALQVVVVNTNVVMVQYQIAASADDTYCSSSGGSTYNNSIMYIPYSSTARFAFLRWPLGIPAGKTILSADVQVKSVGLAGDANPSTASLQLVDTNNCPNFSAANPFTWQVTAANVNWVLPGTWTTNSWYLSGNLKTLVQEFVNRPGYVSGNYLGLRCANFSGNWKQAYQWDNGTHADGAILRVTYLP